MPIFDTEAALALIHSAAWRRYAIHLVGRLMQGNRENELRPSERTAGGVSEARRVLELPYHLAGQVEASPLWQMEHHYEDWLREVMSMPPSAQPVPETPEEPTRPDETPRGTPRKSAPI